MAVQDTVLISANPKSGTHDRRALVDQLQQSIESLGLRCERFTDLDQMSARSHSLFENNELRTVVAAGGDGTASTVASLIPHQVPLTLFPLGSENLLANFYAIQPDPLAVAKAIERMRTKPLDGIDVNGRLSLLMASVGFDAEVVRCVHLHRQSHITRWTYWKAIFQTLRSYRWPTLLISMRDENGEVIEEVEGNWAFVFNVPRYAAGLSIIQEAVEDDGLLDVGVFDSGNMLRGVWYYANVAMKRHQQMKQWHRFQCHSLEIRIKATEQNLQRYRTSCQADGDWVDEVPTRIQILRQRLNIVV